MLDQSRAPLQVIPRSSRLERGGGGLSAPVLGRPHLGDTDLAADQVIHPFSREVQLLHKCSCISSMNSVDSCSVITVVYTNSSV